MDLAMNASVADWVTYIQSLHHREIDMSLERVREVLNLLCPEGVQFKVITIAGTNGKGSTAELAASIFTHAGYHVGKFSSPHLVQFNERFSLSGEDVNDDELLEAFKLVELARGKTPITYFEYCFLVAVALFQNLRVDIAVMEVGLGGRLDAVNVLDADIAIITSISLDHTDWLGDTLDEIGLEKAGVARQNKPCLLGLSNPQHSLLEFLASRKACVEQINNDFKATILDYGKAWAYDSKDLELQNLPLPFSQAGVQLVNAALAIRAVELCSGFVSVSEDDIRNGLSNATIKGRCQVYGEAPFVIFDVAHNEASVARLGEFVSGLSHKGKTIAVCGMLKDKEVEASLEILAPMIDSWFLCDIEGPRGSKSQEIGARIQSLGEELDRPMQQYDNAVLAYQAAKNQLQVDDCLVVFGSFFVVGDIIRYEDENSTAI